MKTGDATELIDIVYKICVRERASRNMINPEKLRKIIALLIHEDRFVSERVLTILEDNEMLKLNDVYGIAHEVIVDEQSIFDI